MQFESRDAETQFRQHFHLQRVTQDRLFAVSQVAVVALLALCTAPQALTPPVRLLFWGANAVSACILGLSCASRAGYAGWRPYILLPARLFYSLLCPQLVWQLAVAQTAAASGDADGWPAFFLLWVTWSRWGSAQFMQAGYLLPFDLEALLSPLGALLDLLNNRRLCRLLMASPEGRRSFNHVAFAELADRLVVPFHVLFAATPNSCTWTEWASSSSSSSNSCSSGASSADTWDMGSTAAGTAGGSSSSNGSQQQADDVSACHCESVFALSQLLLSLVLPLLVVAYGEHRQRRQYAAALLQQQQQLHSQGGRSQVQAVLRRQRQQHLADWHLCHDGLRLLALLTMIQFRVFLSLRFGGWRQYMWAGSPTAGLACTDPAGI